MGYSWEEIYNIVDNRRKSNSPIIDEMIAVRDRNNGDYVLPQLTDEEGSTMPSLSPAIVHDAIENNGMRAGSTVPTVICAAVDSTKQTGRRSREYAKIRRKIITGTYYRSRMQLQMRRAFRHLFGYATFTMVVCPDFKKGCPTIQIRDPLTSYPEERVAENYEDPINGAFIYGKSADWIRMTFPEARSIIPRECEGDEIWDLVEWVDEEDYVIGIMGPRYRGFWWQNMERTWAGRELLRWENKVHMVPMITPCRVTLDRISSQLAKILGTVDVMERMTALDVIAREKSIFPDRYIIGRIGQTPSLVDGEWHDGRSGLANIILDAEKFGSVTFAPDPSSTMAIDRLERNAKISGGLQPQMHGETYGALRTGRGIDALMGASVDPRVQEMQEIMAAHLPYLNEVILQSYRAYWDDKKFIFVSGWSGDPGMVEFTPSIHIETTMNTVTYPIAGTDAQGLTIMLGQLLGTKAISRRTFRERHPFIGDAEEEGARVDEEEFEQMAMQAIMQQVATGMMPPQVLARIETARRENPAGDIFDAVLKVQREIQEEQATPAPEAPEGMVAPPEMQPGLSDPNQLPPSPMAPNAPEGGTIGPNPDLQGLRELMNATAAAVRPI